MKTVPTPAAPTPVEVAPIMVEAALIPGEIAPIMVAPALALARIETVGKCIIAVTARFKQQHQFNPRNATH